MTKLILSLGSTLLNEIPLVKETTTIGRNNDNDIVLDNLSASGHHARVVNTDNKYVLEDLGSTNGTLVNSQKIERKVLEDNDVIAIGKHELRFNGEIAESMEKPSDFEKTVFVRMPAATLAPQIPAIAIKPLPEVQVPVDKNEGGGLVKTMAVIVAVLAVILIGYIVWKMR